MPSPPPWDGLRAAFYLVAAVILMQMLFTGLAAGWCLYSGTAEILAGKFECNKDGRLTSLMESALTAALAFGMAFMNRDKPPPKS
jgi:hypothetical protein